MGRDLKKAKKPVPQRPGGKVYKREDTKVIHVLVVFDNGQEASEAEHVSTGKSSGS